MSEYTCEKEIHGERLAITVDASPRARQASYHSMFIGGHIRYFVFFARHERQDVDIKEISREQYNNRMMGQAADLFGF